ncbi:MAG: hypothetical protein HYX92_00155 [Chloroflexi bacterium]|nr:hypothetical protein [Chloroflexota bacterium]
MMKVSKVSENRILVEDSIEAVNEFALRQGWTDGLPIIPPTIDRVEKMMAGVGRLPGEVVAEILPKCVPGTIERLAANAVMAGCLPSYFPVVVAAVEAIAEPEFSLFRVNSTTNSVGVMLVINGPIRHEIEVNCGYGVFGPGWPANATIGRAIRLVQINVGGSVPGLVSKSTHGHPGRYTMCIGEYEEKSPWEPLHAERGCQRGDSAVTVFPAVGNLMVTDKIHTRARDILGNMFSFIDCAATHTLRYQSGQVMLVLNPDHAKLMGDEGLSKEDVRQIVYEVTSHIQVSRFLEDVRQRFIDEGRVVDGMMKLAPRADYFMIVVAGGEGGLHATMVPGFGGCMPVTKRIERPGTSPTRAGKGQC